MKRQKLNIGIVTATVFLAVAVYCFFQLDFISGFMLIFTGCAFGTIFGEDKE